MNNYIEALHALANGKFNGSELAVKNAMRGVVLSAHYDDRLTKDEYEIIREELNNLIDKIEGRWDYD